ncbi:MAG: hypothetical protein JNM36_11535 [Chitinophagales bacterium]|jgi:hypothetical protein|nr:hypothetical protein [Chitinophagales bacterium]
MKNLILLISFSFLSTLTFAQIKYPSNVQAQLPINGIALPKPDLVFTNFELTSPATISSTSQLFGKTYNHYKVSFKATIKNSGLAPTGSFNVEPNYSIVELGNGFFMNNCLQFSSLNAGESRVIVGIITFKQPANDHRDARVVLKADATCATEFLPSYNFVNESNESNNSSTILTVDIP